MALTYSTTLKTSRITATKDFLVNGTLELLSASNAVIVSYTLSATAGTVTNGVRTLAFTNSTSNGLAAAGTGTNVTKAQISTSGGVVTVTGLTVGGTGSGADIVMTNTNVAEGQSVVLNTATVTHAD